MEVTGYDLVTCNHSNPCFLEYTFEETNLSTTSTPFQTDSFAAYWFGIMGIQKSESIDRFKTIKKKIKEISVDCYKQENIQNMASDYLAHYKELHSAAIYDHDLTRNMLKSIMRAGGNSDDFRIHLRDTLKQVELEISEIRYMS